MDNNKTNEELLKENDLLKERIFELDKFKSKSEQAELALKESEEKYRAMYEETPLSYQSLDIDGNFLDVNPKWLSTLGYSKEEVIGKWFGDFLHPDFVEHFRINFPEFKRRGTVSDVQFYMRKKNGEYIYISFEGCIGYTPTGEFKQTYCVFKDITKEYEIEKQLKESEGKFKTLATNSEEIVYMIAKDGTFLLSEGKGLSKLGLKPGEVVGKSLFDLYKDYPDMLDEMRRTFNGETISSEVKIGEIYFRNWYTPHKNNDGEIIELLGLSVDVTEQKLAEKKVIEESKKAKQYLDIADVILISVESSGKVTLINPKGCEVLGYSEDEIVGKNWFDNFLPKRIRENVKQVLKQVFAGEMESVKYFENEVLKKSGEERLIAWHNAVLKDGRGKIIGTLSSGEDITERKQIETELIAERDKLTAIFEAMQDGVYIVSKDYDIQYVNSVLKKDFGLPEGEKCHKYFHDLDEPCPFCKNEDVFNGKNVQWEWTSPKNGKTYDLIDTPMKNSDGSISKLEIFRDITERKKSEEKIQRFSRIFEDSLNEIFLFDADTYLFTQVNSAAQKNLGYSMEELQEMTPLDLKPEFTIESFAKLVEPLRKGEKEEIVFETVHQRKDKSMYTVEVHLQLLQFENENIFAAIILDITERKKAEVTILKSKSLLSSVIDSPDNVIIFALDTNYNYLSFNKAHVKEMKYIYDADIELGEQIFKYIPNEEDCLKAEINYKRVLKGERFIEIQEYGQAESLFWYELIFNPILDNSQNVSGFTVFVNNITERKLAEEELAKHREKLEELVKERTDELEEKNKKLDNAMKVFVGRELTIRNLQERIRVLKGN